MSLTRDYDNKTMTINQDNYIQTASKKFLSTSSQPYSVPVHSSDVEGFMKMNGANNDE